MLLELVALGSRARGQRRLRKRSLFPTRLVFAAGSGCVDFLRGAGRGQCRDRMSVLPLRCRGRTVGLADELSTGSRDLQAWAEQVD